MNDPKSAKFVELTKDMEWGSIEEIVERLENGGYYDEEFKERSYDEARKADARRMIRRIRTPGDRPVFASLVKPGPDGKEERIYKQYALFDIEDYRQDIQSHCQRANHHIYEAMTLQAEAYRRFDVQLPLPLEMPGPAQAA